ncbi:hypothetical protein [Microbacterium sp. GXF6406]
MASGGARRNSGPAPDPNALRRDRKDDAEWTTLPREGYQGAIPKYPLPDEKIENEKTGRLIINQERKKYETELWKTLWRKPQAALWADMDMTHEVALYVRSFYESVLPDASAGLRTMVLRAGAEIGLTIPGMHSLRWRFADDDLATKRTEHAATARKTGGARARLEALNG